MKDIPAVLGHSSTRVTEELYVFLLEGSKTASAKAIERALWGDEDR